MKTQKLATAVLSYLGAFGLTVGFAAPPENILEPIGAFKPTLNFSDTYGEKVLTTAAPPAEPGEPREPATHEAALKPQKIVAKIVANIEGFDFSGEIADEMPISLKVGAFTFEGTLSESQQAARTGSFPPLGKKATFPFIFSYEKVDRNGDPILDRNGDPITINKKVGSVTFSWTKTRLTVTLSVSDILSAGVAEIAASSYLGLYQDLSDAGNRPSGTVKLGVADRSGDIPFPVEPVAFQVGFGSATGESAANGTGTSTTTHKKFGRDEEGNPLEEFDLQSATLKGKFVLSL